MPQGPAKTVVVDVREADAGRALIVGEIAGNAVRVLRQVGAGVLERLLLPPRARR